MRSAQTSWLSATILHRLLLTRNSQPTRHKSRLLTQSLSSIKTLSTLPIECSGKLLWLLSIIRSRRWAAGVSSRSRSSSQRQAHFLQVGAQAQVYKRRLREAQGPHRC
jgi:hypothetical protein